MLVFTLISILLAILGVGAFKPHRHASRTDSAIQARQLTRERLMGRAEKLTMASLFGREDCSLPEPSTMACTCGAQYTLCDTLCRNIESDPENCNGCGIECPVAMVRRGCCGGVCYDLQDDNSNCGACGNACDNGNSEFCCEGGCRDFTSNPEHCGGCGNVCDVGNDEACCSAGCRTPDYFQTSPLNCGFCGNTCDGEASESCCGGVCRKPSFFDADDQNCGSCGHACAAGEHCCDGSCVSLNDYFNCGVCGRSCDFAEDCCNSVCTFLWDNNDHCGGCGNVCTPPSYCDFTSCALP